MGKKPALSDAERGRISAYKELGLSNREIGRRIGRSLNVVNNFVRLGDEYGRKKPKGKPPSLSERDKRIIRAAAANSTKGTRKIQKELAPHVSHVTVWKVLKESPNLRYEKMKSAPTLTKEHQVLRAEFADLHQTWTTEWQSVYAFSVIHVKIDI